MSYKKIVALLPLLAAAGCATNSDLAEIRALAEQAQIDASLAKQQSAEARDLANQANETSRRNTEQINRSFRSSLIK